MKHCLERSGTVVSSSALRRMFIDIDMEFPVPGATSMSRPKITF
jgi:hypothetical protein